METPFFQPRTADAVLAGRSSVPTPSRPMFLVRSAWSCDRLKQSMPIWAFVLSERSRAWWQFEHYSSQVYSERWHLLAMSIAWESSVLLIGPFEFDSSLWHKRLHEGSPARTGRRRRAPAPLSLELSVTGAAAASD